MARAAGIDYDFPSLARRPAWHEVRIRFESKSSVVVLCIVSRASHCLELPKHLSQEAKSLGFFSKTLGNIFSYIGTPLLGFFHFPLLLGPSSKRRLTRRASSRIIDTERNDRQTLLGDEASACANTRTAAESRISNA